MLNSLNMGKIMDKLLTTKEVSKIISMSESALHRWRHDDILRLPWISFGTAIRYKKSDVERFINKSTVVQEGKTITINIPDAFLELPDRTIITTKELALIIGVSARKIPKLVRNGDVPPPTKYNEGKHCKRADWSLGSLRSFKASREIK